MTTIFLHIPKTGGTTTRHYMKRGLRRDETCFVYRGEKRFTQPDELLAMDRKTVDGLRFICGHFDHAFAASVPCSDRRLATIMRNPVMRGLSLYHHRMIHQLKRRDLSVGEVLERNLIRELHNNQTRILSGIALDPGGCNNRILGVAQHNLASSYSYVGFTESMETSVKGEMARLGLPDVEPKYLNKTRKRTGLPSVIWSDISALVEANHFDLMLYRFALHLRMLQIKHRSTQLPPIAMARMMQHETPCDGQGTFGSIDQGIAKGWASSGCESVPEVVLFVRNHAGAVVFQTAKAGRPGLANKVQCGTNYCGFDADISSLLDSASADDRIHAYALSRMQELDNSPIRVADAS